MNTLITIDERRVETIGDRCQQRKEEAQIKQENTFRFTQYAATGRTTKSKYRDFSTNNLDG